MEKTACEKCGVPYGIGDWPFCPHEGVVSYNVQGDEIPGGIEIRHGLVNTDGSPRKFYSKSEIAKAAKEAGLTNVVRHVGEPGTDKSKHTVRWI